MTPTACRDLRPMLSAYVDGELDEPRAAAVRLHLRGCGECAGVVADLERLVAAASGLGPMVVPDRVRVAVEGQIESARTDEHRSPRRRRAVGALAQWAGLSAALLAITTIASLLRPAAPSEEPGRSSPVATAEAPTETNGIETAEPDVVTTAVEAYDREIAALEEAVGAQSNDLEPTTAAAITSGSDTVNQAIAESRAAVRASPDSEPAQMSLFEALRRKIAMLQATVTLINEMHQGDPAGAAEAAEGLGRES